MKLTTIFLLAACLQLSAKGVSQTVSITVKDVPLLTVLKEIKKQTGYFYLADNEWLQKAKNVTLSAVNWPLQKVLDECFKGQPLTYNISGKVINIVPREEKPKGVSMVNEVPPIDVRGRVVNENGEPVQASITVKGTKEGTTTNANGEFRLQGVDDNAVLVISGVGIEEREFKVAGKNNLSVVVKIAVKPLDEVQMIAYGTTTKRLNTGNVSSVKASDIEKQPINNPLLALQGRVSGLYISQSTGIPGSAIKVQIRGQNSIQNGNDPFYVIDGVPYTSQLLPNLNTTLGTSVTGQNVTTNFGNPLSYINPSDIESIEVLKDADATAIYGSRAANGAILITTKKGKVGRTDLEINIQNGWGKVGRKLDLLNTDQYLAMRHEGINNDGTTVSQFDYDLNGTWDSTNYTDWQKALIGKTSNYMDAQLSIHGGSNNTSYLIAGGYHKETTVTPGNFNDQKGSIHFNLNSSSNNNKFRIQLNGSYLVDNNHLPGIDLTQYALQLAPNAPSLYKSDGTLNWALPDTSTFSFGSWTNPLAYLNNKFKGQTNNLLSNAIISFQLLPSLQFKSNIGYTYMHVDEISYFPSTYFDPYLVSLVGNSLRTASYANNLISSWIIEPQINYFKRMGRGRIDALIGFSIQQNKMKGIIINGSGYNSDLLLEDPQSASTSTLITSNSLYKYNGFFGRINYNWNDKYLLNLNARRDGSSRFGPANKFHNFWSIGSGWIFTSEKIIQRNLPFLSFGKVRVSYGTTGNDQIANYQFFDLYRSGSYAVPYQGNNGLYLTNPYNPFLQWEETKKFESGIELGFLKDKILLTVSYFQNRSSNQLVQNPLPLITGFNSVIANLPATIENTGFEINLNSANIKSKTFNWSTSINLTIPKNKLISFPGIENSVYKNTYEVNQPITVARPYHFFGVDPTTGLYTFSEDQGGTVFTPDNSTVRDFVNLAPIFYGGVLNTFSYKRFQVDFLFQFTKQTGRNYLFGYLPGYIGFNQPSTVLDRWQKPGELTQIQRFTSSTGFSVNGNNVYSAFNYANQSTLVYSDASFIRCKNVSLSWRLPDIFNKKIKFQDCRIFIQGQNLLTITNYKGLDPETQSTSLPPLRVWTIGLNANL